jgi:polar amino acid transport system permease protein
LVRWPLMAFIDVFRAIPPMCCWRCSMRGCPLRGSRPRRLGLGGAGLPASTPAPTTAEILRAGIESVPRGQAEAARSRLSRGQAWSSVVLPQAVRNVLPDLISNTLEVVKLTSIASVVALPELLFQARQAQSVTFNATPDRGRGRGLFLLLWPCVRLLSRLRTGSSRRGAEPQRCRQGRPSAFQPATVRDGPRRPPALEAIGHVEALREARLLRTCPPPRLRAPERQMK